MTSRDGLALGKIIVAFDGSTYAERAMDFACSLAKKYSSELTVVHVYSISVTSYPGIGPTPAQPFEAAVEAAKKRGGEVLDRGVELAAARGVKPRGELIGASSTVQAIVEFAASQKADLVVVGTRGVTGFKKLVLGSVSNGVVSHSESPVLVVR